MFVVEWISIILFHSLCSVQTDIVKGDPPFCNEECVIIILVGVIVSV